LKEGLNWINNSLKAMSKSDQKVFLGCLTPEQRALVKQPSASEIQLYGAYRSLAEKKKCEKPKFGIPFCSRQKKHIKDLRDKYDCQGSIPSALQNTQNYFLTAVAGESSAPVGLRDLRSGSRLTRPVSGVLRP